MNRCRFSWGALITSTILVVLSVPSVSIAETDYSDPVFSKQRQRFLKACGTAGYNDNCARFYESQHAKRKSINFCDSNPEDPACSTILQEKEAVEEERRAVSVHREIAAYCRLNQDAPRCAKRSKKNAQP